MCAPELQIATRQFGWSGETAQNFLRRMTNDCLRFKPTIATLCYGMNDFGYMAFTSNKANWYRSNETAVVDAFKSIGTRVIAGSAGCVGLDLKRGIATSYDMNMSLCMFRDVTMDIAAKEHVAFADVFWPMFTSSVEARSRYGTNYMMSGRDGIHPENAGHLIMARAFLKSMGLEGQIGTFTVDLKSGKAKATTGHKV